ncbi:MAG: ATP-dependent DNA ligase [Thermoplasmata archaeon]
MKEEMPRRGRPDAPLRALVDAAGALAATRSRLTKREILVEFLAGLKQDEVAPAVLLLTGRVLPESQDRTLNLGWATVSRALEASEQTTLLAEELTILQVYHSFQEIARVQGKDSVKKKRRLLQALLAQASGAEKDLLLRAISREMRIGVNEGVMLEALADASGADVPVVQRANMFLGDLGQTAQIALTGGATALAAQQLRLFTPIKPMMAEMADDLEEAFREHEAGTALEFKLDGARIQIHRSGDEIRIFTRRLTEVTESLPDVVTEARRFQGGDLLVEGEVVALGEGDRPLPFQDLMRRFRRIHDVEALVERIPLQLYLFDALLMEGTLLIDLPYEERWARLASAVPAEVLVPRLVRPTLEQGQAFFEEALEAGHEGLVAKDLGSPYTPGKRGKRWFKVKPTDTLDVAILAAEWGHGRRHGWLSNYHLGVRDEQGGFAMIGKTFKGLTDEEFREMTRRLLALKVRENRYVVTVEPRVVVEVAFNEIQRSPHYKSGYALRFARVTRIRDDKAWAETDSLHGLEARYQKQFERKGKLRDA